MTPPDRFAPPRADVADLPGTDPLLASRPRSVVAACVAMLAAMALGLVSLLPVVEAPMAGEPAAMTAMLWGFTIALSAVELWLLRQLWRRRAWARWAVIALAVAGVAMGMGLVEEDWARSPLVAWMGIASVVLEFAAALLLLARPAARWCNAAPQR